MKLDRVTITGADESVHPEALVRMSDLYPWTEWGILISTSKAGTPRFPGRLWLEQLARDAKGTSLKLSAHICGGWARQLLLGKVEFRPKLDRFLECCQRVQLNFRPEGTPCDPEACFRALHAFGKRQFIFQLRDDGNEHMDAIADAADCANLSLDLVGLFDKSGGSGTVPGEWPKPQYLHVDPGEHGEGVESYKYHGYAGGLGPDTLDRELPRIAKAAGDARIWLDMESRVRSHHDQQFDFVKINDALTICEGWIARDA